MLSQRVRPLLAAGVVLSMLGTFLSSAHAVPRKVILLRHGEKANAYALCAIGQQRSLALRDTYLGRNATNSVLLGGQAPAAFLAITLHTLELAAPSAQSWGMPINTYAVVPLDGGGAAVPQELKNATRIAAADVLSNPAWHDRTVVMTWQHTSIANARLERQNPGEKVTLRQLLNLDRLPGVPETWPGKNYDYFWVVNYDPQRSEIPTSFEMVKQVYAPPFNTLPQNDWGAPLPKGYAAGCKS